MNPKLGPAIHCPADRSERCLPWLRCLAVVAGLAVQTGWAQTAGPSADRPPSGAAPVAESAPIAVKSAHEPTTAAAPVALPAATPAVSRDVTSTTPIAPMSPPGTRGWWARAQGGQRLSESWAQARAAAADAAQASAAPASAGAQAPAPRAEPYTLALMWIAPAARPAQRQQLRRLLKDLGLAAEREPQSAELLARLRQDLASMPVTGRVPLPAHDMAWLQAHPAQDPVLSEGDEWWQPPQPSIVRAWLSSGERCDLDFQPGALTAAYVSACARTSGDDTPMADSVWVVQPDGRVQTIGIAAWNARQQAAPAPGAWIWAPRRDNPMPGALHEALARWLATQGAAGTDTVPSAEGLAPVTEPPSSVPPPQVAQARQARDLPRLASDWGVTGLLQTPTARTRSAGAFGLSVSRTWPYTQVNLVMSPFERMEVGVRYTRVSNMLYGPAIAGDRSYLDKSAEVKFRLTDEGIWTPALSLGLRDLGGTGMFAGEYLVASKRWGDFDFSLGLGWGYLGGRADLPNPLAKLGLRDAVRQGGQAAMGGTANLGSMFTGPTALFGGVQWHSPWNGLVVKLELDGNDYQNEPSGQRLDSGAPVNVGVAWRWNDAELSLSWQRGRQWSLGLSWIGSLPSVGMPKTALPRWPAVEPMQAVQAAPAAAAHAPAAPMAAAPVQGAQASVNAPAAAEVPAPVATDPASSIAVVAAPMPAPQAAAQSQAAGAEHALLVELARHSGWHATRLVREPTLWTVHLDHAGGAHVRERIERLWAVLHREAPPEVSQFALELASRQMPMARHEVDRRAWVDSRSRHLARHQQPDTGPPDGVQPVQEPKTSASLTPSPAETPRIATGVNLGFQQHLGGPNGYLYALSLRGFGQVRAWEGAWLQGSLAARLVDNYDGFDYTAPSALPRVRTHLREYVTTRRLTLPNLQFNQAARLAEGLYGLAYAGWLEPMFAGVGAELLWRPLNSRWAASLDLNLVRKRAFEQDLDLQDYQVKTGHLTVRWDTGWHDIVAGVSVGQYLAGDRGVTLDLSRVFANGTRMGLWATKTNVSAAQFGEGSFDKGLYLTVPFDAMFTSWSGSAMTVAWQPLIRDGGAKLNKGASLWGMTDVRDLRIMDFRPAQAEVKAD